MVPKLTSRADADELEWYIPSAILPKDLQRCLNTINQYLETPIDLEGKKPAELLQKKRRRRTRRKQPESDAEDENADLRQSKRKEKRKKEKQQYKSAEFIVDSDAEMGDMDDFLAKERALRQKTAALAASTGHVATMRSHGTRKRRRKGKEDKDKRKRRKHGEDGDRSDDDEASGEDKPAEKKQDESDSEESEQDVFGSPKRAASESTPDTSPAVEDAAADEEASELSAPDVPKGKVLACDPFVTDFCVAGSKKRLGSLAGSCAWTRPLSCEFFGAFWQKTELRLVGGFVVKSY